MKSNAAPQMKSEASNVEWLLALRESYQALKKRLDAMEETVDELESGIIAQVESGLDFSIFGYEIKVQESTRRYPAWKEHFIERLGKSEADSVLAATKPTILKKLVIG